MKHTSKVSTRLLCVILFSLFGFSASAQTWTGTGSMAVARRDHTATLLNNGKVLIQRGPPAELYDPVTGTFSLTGTMVFGHGSFTTATRLSDGRVLIAGGPTVPTAAEIYDPETGTFSPTGNLNEAHRAHTATLLSDGRVLIAAGQGNVGLQTHAVAELYDPATGTFSLTGSLNEDRNLHTATLLPNGQVLITGGSQSTTPGFVISLSAAELYDPATGTFSLTGSMNQSRSFHTATLLPNGQVLIAGTSNLAELYDPTTGIFSLTGNMNEPRAAPTATLLTNGQVLIAGGVGTVAGGPVTTNSAELYDPETGTFATTSSMTSARQQHIATLLSNGQVLVTGGFDFGGGANLSSAELFSLGPAFIEVTIDIVPGNDPNAINPAARGLIPVAVLTTESFDALTISPSTVQFGPAGASIAHRSGHLEDVDSDGDLDLVLHFRTQEAGIQCGDTEASLSGETFDGQAIQGSDSIMTVGCH